MNAMTDLLYAFKDCLVLSGRGSRHLLRRFDTLLTSAILPIMILILFNYLFGGAMSLSLGGASYLNFVLPGILLMSVGYVATTTASSISDDIGKGLVNRLKSMPVARPAFIVGHIFSSLIRNVVAIVCVVAVALLLGYRSPATFPEWCAAMGVMLLFSLAMTAVAVVLGLLASGPDAASAYSMPLMFLAYFTGAFVPIYTMPAALQVFCTYQPINIVLQSLSGLLSGGSGFNIWASLAWCIGISAACLVLGGILFARKATR